jgi:hypothetical protein
MNEKILILIYALGMAFAGWLIGFGQRGLIESMINRNVKGYKNYWERRRISKLKRNGGKR